MIISLLVAMDEKRGIGKAGKLPWRLSADMRRFRALTMGHHIIVGRKTFESIGKTLPGREMIVVTRDESLKPDGCLTARSVEAAIALARERGETEVFVCGGTEIYAHALGAANRMYLTQVHAIVDADTFFPEFDESAWRETEKSFQQADEKNQYAFTFKVLERKNQ
ncbi:MAG TPA: dihydrofolate reductase [Blastocatellia bacterium]|nr:dihydrofolate reductase [Blastocatellia bacterium]